MSRHCLLFKIHVHMGFLGGMSDLSPIADVSDMDGMSELRPFYWFGVLVLSASCALLIFSLLSRPTLHPPGESEISDIYPMSYFRGAGFAPLKGALSY
jgi:hypothetical protein